MKIFSKRSRKGRNGPTLLKRGSRIRFLRGISNRDNSKSGVTLVEVVLALLILTIMLVVTVKSLSYPRFMVVTSTRKQAAIHAANESLEEAVSFGYAYCFANRADPVPSGNLNSTYTLHGHDISGSRTVSEWNAESPPTLLVTVSVNYLGMDAPLVLETLITP